MVSVYFHVVEKVNGPVKLPPVSCLRVILGHPWQALGCATLTHTEGGRESGLTLSARGLYVQDDRSQSPSIHP